MGIWDDMKAATIGGGGNYLPAGFNGDVKIKRCQLHKGFQADEAFIAEFEILSTNMPGKVDEGTSASWYQGKLNHPKMRGTALGEVKGFVAAVCGIDPRDAKAIKERVDPELVALMEAVTGEENAFEGRTVHVETWNKVTKEQKKDFTKHAFSPSRAA